MKRVFFSLCVLSGALFFSCSNISEDDFNKKPTELIVTVLDQDGNVVTDAEVYLYRDRSSLESRIGAVAFSETDSIGNAFFTDLLPEQYYIYAFFTDDGLYFDNSKDNFVVPDVLIESSLTEVNVQTLQQREEDPEFVRFVGIHYTNTYSEKINQAQAVFIAGLYLTNANGSYTLDQTDVHYYEGGLIIPDSNNYSDSLEVFYSSMSDMYPLIYGENVYSLEDIALVDIPFTFEFDQYGGVNVQDKNITANIPLIIQYARNHEIPFPNRIRLGETGIGFDEELFVDLLLEWK